MYRYIMLAIALLVAPSVRAQTCPTGQFSCQGSCWDQFKYSCCDSSAPGFSGDQSHAYDPATQGCCQTASGSTFTTRKVYNLTGEQCCPNNKGVMASTATCPSPSDSGSGGCAAAGSSTFAICALLVLVSVGLFRRRRSR